MISLVFFLFWLLKAIGNGNGCDQAAPLNLLSIIYTLQIVFLGNIKLRKLLDLMVE